jgi:hypothetical protein
MDAIAALLRGVLVGSVEIASCIEKGVSHALRFFQK